MSLRAFAVILGALMIAPIPFAAAAPPSFDLTPTTFLVGFEPGQRDGALAQVQLLKGNVTGHVPQIDTLVIVLPAGSAALLARHPAISYVEVDAQTTLSGTQWDGAQWDGAQWNGAQWNGAQWDGTIDTGLQNGWQWGLDAIRAPSAWITEPGHRKASLCVTDSGVDASHRDLKPHVTRQTNAIDNSSNVADGGGHGTHVAGIAAAVHLDGFGVGGVSNSTILSAKVLNANGTGSASSLARGVSWCVDQGADVILMALTLQGSSSTVARAIDYAASKGVVMVASAGNAGCNNCVSYPARDSRVIAVAAHDRNGALASFSSNGPEVALRAPGVGILSTLPSGSFGYGSGTSQAAAFVAGTAALLLEAKPTLSPSGVRSALVAGSPGGVLDAQGALGKVVPLVTPAPAPSPTTNATEPVSTTSTGTVDAVTATATLDGTSTTADSGTATNTTEAAATTSTTVDNDPSMTLG